MKYKKYLFDAKKVCSSAINAKVPFPVPVDCTALAFARESAA